jgi:hypothetical protein
LSGKGCGLSEVWLRYDTYAPLVSAATHQVPVWSPYDAIYILQFPAGEVLVLYFYFIFWGLKTYIKSGKGLLTVGLEFEDLVSRVPTSFVKYLQDCNKYWCADLRLYHVELRSQLCERSSSIISFIKELENIKK